ncbi:hypothetical protein PMAYCL1PPCAC_03148, partial [Pristionchus mayeri]
STRLNTSGQTRLFPLSNTPFQDSNAPVCVLSSASISSDDVETALSFNLSQISTDSDAMGSKRSKKSRREKRNSQRVSSSDIPIADVAMKLEQCEIPIEAPTVAEDTVIDGVVLVDPLPVVSPPRASCIPVLCRTATTPASETRSDRSYSSIRRISEDFGTRPSRIPRWVDITLSSSSSASSDTSLLSSSEAASTPDQTVLSYDDDFALHHSISSVSSLGRQLQFIDTSSVEDAGCYATEPASVLVSLDSEKHGIKMELGIELAMPSARGGPLILSSITVPE